MNPNLDSVESSGTFPGFLDNIARSTFEHSPKSFRIFPEVFINVSLNIFKHSLESFEHSLQYFQTFLFQHSSESFRTFPGIFLSIPQNLAKHFLESSWTFPGVVSEDFPESSGIFRRNFLNTPWNTKMTTFPGIF